MPRGSVLLLVVALGAATACSEEMTAPTDPVDVAFARATHDQIPAPVLTPVLTDDDVLLTYTWQDDAAWDFVTFSIWVDGVRTVDGLRVRPYPADYLFTASWTQYNVLPGSYEYCVKVLAKSKPVKHGSTATNHSSACVTVDVPT